MKVSQKFGIYLLKNNYLGGDRVTQEKFSTDNLYGDGKSGANLLWQYVKSLNPETIALLSKPNSQEVLQLMERNIAGLLGNLPSEQYGIKIDTTRENLSKLLVSAMMSGYFLRNAEQRMDLEKSWQK